MINSQSIKDLPILLERDLFLRNLISELAKILEEIVGYEEATGYISLVGQKIGNWINEMYKKELGVSVLSPEIVPNVLVDLKNRIQGNFNIIDQSDEKIILGNDHCPFGRKVIERPSMCMMTSNVFGIITASNLGYAKVVLEKTLADKQDGCEVIIYLKPTPEAELANGREYYGY